MGKRKRKGSGRGKLQQGDTFGQSYLSTLGGQSCSHKVAAKNADTTKQDNAFKNAVIAYVESQRAAVLPKNRGSLINLTPTFPTQTASGDGGQLRDDQVGFKRKREEASAPAARAPHLNISLQLIVDYLIKQKSLAADPFTTSKIEGDGKEQQPATTEGSEAAREKRVAGSSASAVQVADGDREPPNGTSEGAGEFTPAAAVEDGGLEAHLPRVPQEIRDAVYKRDQHACRYCCYDFKLREGQQGFKAGRRISLDHSIPESAGGPTSMENLVVACQNQCNGSKDALWYPDLVYPHGTGLTSFRPQASEVVGRCPFNRPDGARAVQDSRALNAQVAAAVEALVEKGVFEGIGGGFPANFHAVRGAIEVLDHSFATSPLKGSIQRRAELQARGGREEEVRQDSTDTDGQDEDKTEQGAEEEPGSKVPRLK